LAETVFEIFGSFYKFMFFFQAILYNEVVNYKNALGHTICDPFVRLPNKRFYPMYYDDIENPISLKMVRKKIQTKKYEVCLKGQ